VKREIPNVSTLRKYYVKRNYDSIIDKIRENLSDFPIYLIIDETTDRLNRYVVNVLVGRLDGDKSKPMLVSTQFVEETNYKSIQQCFLDALNIIWPKKINYDKVWLVVTDQASYMLKAFDSLKSGDLFPNMHHITCIAHALHRVSLKITKENEEINSLISLFKKVTVKSPLREYQFRRITGLSLPPKPVVTRWGTWLNAAFYYSANYMKIHEFVSQLPNSSVAIRKLKQLFESQTLKSSLLEIRGMNFLTKAIEKLQTQSLKTSQQMEILENVRSQLSGKSLEKLNISLKKNRDLKRFTESTDFDFKWTTRYAPLVSVDVERSFSQYKDILSDKRCNMTTETIEHLNIICYNRFLSEN
jgi:hypothetical protein